MSIQVRSITDLMTKFIHGGKEDRTLFGFSPDIAIDNMGTDNFFLEKQFKCNICEKNFSL